jgi:AraC family transcriptional regulator of adaptative response/methylated-DNA-[protein]-cysteine methyltransferase
MSSTKHVGTQRDGIRWQAVLDRSSGSTAKFFYGVRTTKVYCRPTCPSRQPLRRNVEFFESGEAAVAAGYRPCRRCRPDSEEGAPWVTLVCRTIEESQVCPTLAELAELIGLSPSHLQRTFRRTMGVSPHQYGAAVRTRRLRTELASGTSVTQAIYDSGFTSSGAAYGQSQAALGMTPKRFRERGRGERISYTIMSSPLGEVLVAATTIGLVAVRIGTGDELERELRTEFAQATLVRDDDVVTPQALAVLERIVHHRETTDLPLDIAATAFQAKVWNALRAIPIGSTRSYGEVAAQIGAPKSARAVASACAHNPVAVVIPCHRVVHADGTMSGYRWGVSVKAQLLDEERR